MVYTLVENMNIQRQRSELKFGLGLILAFVLCLSGCGGGGGSNGGGAAPGGGGTGGNGGNGGNNQSGPVTGILANAGVVSTLAGTAQSIGSFNGTGSAATFLTPKAITSDGTNLYIADTANHIIRQMVISTGVVSTLAGTARTQGSSDGTGTAALFNQPSGITTDGINVYVSDTYNGTIRQIVIATGAVTTLVGNAALLCAPKGITNDGTNLFVADTCSDTIRKIVISTGEISTLAGTAYAIGSADGAGATARFFGPGGITTDGTNLYVSDTYNNTIRQIVIATGTVTTLAGTAGVQGSTDAAGAAASFNRPFGITTDGTNVYVADAENNTVRQIVIATGAVTTLAGTQGLPGCTDATGIAARFSGAAGIIGVGLNLYVADTNNDTVRQIVKSSGVVTTIAGQAGNPSSSDGIGSAAQFLNPNDVATDGTNLYVADRLNSTIRKIVIATGAVTTLAGTPLTTGSTDATGASALFYYPQGIATDGTNLYVADTFNSTIRKIVIATGAVTTLAGKARNFGGYDGTGATASFYYPAGITTDGTNLYVLDIYYSKIRKIVISTGVVTTVAGGYPTFFGPTALTTDGKNLYVADTQNQTIHKVVISTGSISTLAGTTSTTGSTDATGASARFNFPQGITIMGTNLYVSDTKNHTIRKIDTSSGIVTTIAGLVSTAGHTDGVGLAAHFCDPAGITNDGTNLYLADSCNNSIRKIH